MATTAKLEQRSVSAVLPNAWRVFIALWYLGGSVIHLQCALYRPEIYARFEQTPLIPAMGRIWADVLMPHITAFALLLAVFELVVVILLLSKGWAVKLGLAASLGFNLFLVLLGLGYPATPGTLQDFVLNRLSNVVFILAQLPLFWCRFDKSLPGFIRAQFRS
jgi:hypothetical protein